MATYFPYWNTVEFYKNRANHKKCRKGCTFNGNDSISLNDHHCCSHRECYVKGGKCILRCNRKSNQEQSSKPLGQSVNYDTSFTYSFMYRGRNTIQQKTTNAPRLLISQRKFRILKNLESLEIYKPTYVGSFAISEQDARYMKGQINSPMGRFYSYIKKYSALRIESSDCWPSLAKSKSASSHAKNEDEKNPLKFTPEPDWRSQTTSIHEKDSVHEEDSVNDEDRIHKEDSIHEEDSSIHEEAAVDEVEIIKEGKATINKTLDEKLSKKKIRKTISEMMTSHDLNPQRDIPCERKFDISVVNPYSLRFFSAQCTINFNCPDCFVSFRSTALCYIDLKTQTICHRFKKDCKQCKKGLIPMFTEAEVQDMAASSIKKYLIFKERN